MNWPITQRTAAPKSPSKTHTFAKAAPRPLVRTPGCRGESGGVGDDEPTLPVLVRRVVSEHRLHWLKTGVGTDWVSPYWASASDRAFQPTQGKSNSQSRLARYACSTACAASYDAGNRVIKCPRSTRNHRVSSGPSTENLKAYRAVNRNPA